MDGFEPGASVVVMAATNRAEILDSALLRPGRFDRTVEIPLPNQVERTAILAIHGQGKKLARDVDLDAVSRGTPGFSGADLANLVNEAAINAVRARRDVLTAADFDAARDRLLIGRRDASNALLPEEKYSVAVHEAGHALVAALSEHADPVAKVTILPRGAALGVTEQLPALRAPPLPPELPDRLAHRPPRWSGRRDHCPWASPPQVRPTTSPAPPTWPRGWSGNGDFLLKSAPSVTGRRGRAAITPSPAVPTPRRRSAPSTRRWRGCCRDAETRATKLLCDNRDTLDRVIELLLDRETIDGAELAIIAAVPNRAPEPELVLSHGAAKTAPPSSRDLASRDLASRDLGGFEMWRLWMWLSGPSRLTGTCFSRDRIAARRRLSVKFARRPGEEQGLVSPAYSRGLLRSTAVLPSANEIAPTASQPCFPSTFRA